MRFAIAIGVVAAAACSRAGEESRSKRSPAPPPPDTVEVPADLRIPVTTLGIAGAPIDAARLTALAPDFADDDRRAWRLTTLVPAFDQPGRAIEADGASGLSIRLVRPAQPGALTPVLFLTRRGEVVVTLVDPREPFPDFHGQGGRLRRPGDSQPHVSPVTALRVVVAGG
jgi:hypothetical protein